MDIKETAVIISMLKLEYPMAYKNMTKSEGQQLIMLWHNLLGDYPKEIVETAVKAWMLQSHEFPPNAGQINAEIVKLTAKPKMSALEAWSLVEKSIDYYCATENFNKLPEDIQNVLGSPQVLHDWACESINNLSVNASNFMRHYTDYMKHKDQMILLPDSLLDKIKALADKHNNMLLKGD